MKFSLLPLIATSLPLLLVQHITPANAAALCIPGIYCPQATTIPPAVAECSCTASVGGAEGSSSSGGTGHHSSPSSQPKPISTVDPKPMTTAYWTSTPVVTEPPYTTTTTCVSGGGSSTTESIASSSAPIGNSSGGSGSTVTTTVTVTSAAPSATGSTCSTGPVQCCDSVEPASSENASSIMALLGIVLQGANIPVGLNCAPIDVLGLGSGGTCNAQTVCCQNDSFNGLINIGCSPINIGL